MALQNPPACYFLDPTARLNELSLHIKESFILNEFGNYFKKSNEEAQHEAIKVDPSYSLEDEAKRLFNEVQSAMEIVKETNFYCKLVNQLDSSVFQKQLKILLGSHSTLKMVIYGLGTIEFSYSSLFQLAISLLMKEICSWIEEIEVYDPRFVRTDIIVLKKAGCNVLTINENARRSVDKPTLFFIPYGDNYLYGNVFEANWCPSQINQLLLLCSSPLPAEFDDEYINAVKNYSIEIPLVNYGNGGIVDRFAWHFFKVDSDLDMDILISDKVTKWERMENRRLSKEERLLRRRERAKGSFSFTFMHCRLETKLLETMFLEPYDENTDYDDQRWFYEIINKDCGLKEYRGPRMYRCIWHAPPKGWMKLNIASSSRRDREELGESLIMTGYGGICHNENKESVLDYKGKIDKADEFGACVEALKIGLEDILKKFGAAKQKLIVETDNFKLVHWANPFHRTKPPAFQVEEFQPVQDLLNQYDRYIIYHIYKEANEEAICLAKQETSL